MQLMGSIGEIVVQLRHKVLSSCELCEAALQRQAAVSTLKPFINSMAQDAKISAAASTKRYRTGKPLSPLDGIPVAVKDNFCTRHIPTTCGSKMLQNYLPPYSATVVTRLQEAGAVIVGKTNMDEFGMGSGTIDSTIGPSRNIYRSGVKYKFHGTDRYPTGGLDDGDWYVTGGSSGGSALAVASGAAFIGVGSDTGGSVRNPASYCGVVGLKPSYGLVPRTGLVSLVNSMDVPGLLGRSVDDVATLLGVLAGHDPKDSTSVASELKDLELPLRPSLEGLVVGVPREYHCEGVSQEVLEAWSSVADLMEDSGAQVREVSMPHAKYSIICYSVLNPCEVASNFTRYTGVEYGLREDSSHSMEAMYALTRSAGLSQVVRSRVLAGNYFLLKENKEKYLKQALKVRRLITDDFKRVWSSGVDLLLSPVTLSAAIRYSKFCETDNRSQMEVQDFCTQSANMAGVPAVSVPVSLNPNGLPLALQLMAPWGQDATLLSAAKWIQQQVNFPRLHIDQS